MKYVWSKQEILKRNWGMRFVLISLHCDVCGYCSPINPDSFPEVSDKYSVPDLAPRIRGLSVRRSRRYTVGQQTSKQTVCLEICVRLIIVCTNSLQKGDDIFSNNFTLYLYMYVVGLRNVWKCACKCAMVLSMICCNSKFSISSHLQYETYINCSTYFSVVTWDFDN